MIKLFNSYCPYCKSTIYLKFSDGLDINDITYQFSCSKCLRYNLFISNYRVVEDFVIKKYALQNSNGDSTIFIYKNDNEALDYNKSDQISIIKIKNIYIKPSFDVSDILNILALRD